MTLPNKVKELLRGLWTSRADFEQWFARGYEVFRREERARIRALDPPSPVINPLERSRRDMQEQIDGLPWDGLNRLQMPSYYTPHGKLLRDDARANWRGVNVHLMAHAGLMMAYFDRHAVPFFVHSAIRGKIAQDGAYASGNSTLRWPNSAHNRGYGYDLVHGRFAWELTDREWRAVGEIGKRIWDRYMATIRPENRLELVWGGDWKKPYDPAHWEIKGYRSMPFDQANAEFWDGRDDFTRTRTQLRDIANHTHGLVNVSYRDMINV